MQSRPFGRTGRQVGEIGEAEAALDAATMATLKGTCAREIRPSVDGRW